MGQDERLGSLLQQCSSAQCVVFILATLVVSPAAGLYAAHSQRTLLQQVSVPSVDVNIQVPTFPLTEQQCLDSLVTALQNSCASNKTATMKSADAKRLVSRPYLACMESASGGSSSQGSAARIMVPQTLYATYAALLSNFSEAYPDLPPILLSPVDGTYLLDEMRFEITTRLQDAHDGWIFNWVGAVQLLYAMSGLPNPLQNLDDDPYHMTTDPVMAWHDVPTFYQSLCKPAVVLGSREITHNVYVPLQGVTRVMYYRTDILQANNLPVPRTWSEVLAVATRINGTVDPATNITMWGICLDPDDSCSFAWLMGAVSGPYLQTNTSSQGGLFAAPVRGRTTIVTPLFNTTGSQEAQATFAQLLKLSPQPRALGETKCLGTGSGNFQAGRCAIGFGAFQHFKSIEQPNGLLGPGVSVAKGRYAVAQLPGSERVQPERANLDCKATMDCTPLICPFGLSNQPEQADILTLNGSTKRVFINRAPSLVSGGTVGAINKFSSDARKLAVYRFLAYLSSAPVSLAMVLQPQSPVRVLRPSVFAMLAEPSNLAAGHYDAGTLAQITYAIMRSLEHTNAVLPLDVPGYDAIKNYMTAAVQGIIYYKADCLAGLKLLQQQVISLVASIDSSAFTTAYLMSIGYIPLGFNSSMPSVAVAVPVVSAAVVIMLSTIYEFRKHRKHKNLFGKVVAPGPLFDTTLLITDIQDSTALWEVLPPSVMDKAIKEHHQCIRRLLLKHSGYESATEGDSFILAFHCAEDALLFAMEAQVALLECDWPRELLEHEVARPCYVVQVEVEQRKAMGMLLDDPGALPAASLSASNSQGSRSPAASEQYASACNTETAAAIAAAASAAAEGKLASLQVSGGAVTPASTAAVAGRPSLRLLSQRQILGAMSVASRTASGGGAAGNMFSSLSGAVQSLGGSGWGGSSAALHVVGGGNVGLGGSVVGAEPYTFMAACQSSWKEASADKPNIVLIFRGLRVRMGLHTGITNEADVAYNKAAARVQYSGEILLLAKAVSDAAAGGMILLSEVTYRRLPMERLWDKAMVMHIGEYLLQDHIPRIDMYQVTGRRLMGRLGYLSAMRYKQQLSRGVHAAPLGTVAVVYMDVVGASTLLAWNEDVARAALQLFMHEATSELHRLNGYLVSASDERLVAVFHGVADAVAWALATHEAMLHADWPAELFDHELAEELIAGNTVMFRGLRLKSGIDCGEATGEVNAMTGRICYRGKVVQRAARIMQAAASNQVLCSSEAWTSALQSAPSFTTKRIHAEKLPGPSKLRGGLEKVDVLQCSLSTRPMGPISSHRMQTLQSADSWNSHLELMSPRIHELGRRGLGPPRVSEGGRSSHLSVRDQDTGEEEIGMVNRSSVQSVLQEEPHTYVRALSALATYLPMDEPETALPHCDVNIHLLEPSSDGAANPLYLHGDSLR